MLFQPLVGLPSVSKNDREEERSDEEDEEEDDAVSDDEDYEDSTPAPRTAFRRSTPTRPYSASSHASHTPSRVASRNSLNVRTNSSSSYKIRSRNLRPVSVDSNVTNTFHKKP